MLLNWQVMFNLQQTLTARVGKADGLTPAGSEPEFDSDIEADIRQGHGVFLPLIGAI